MDTVDDALHLLRRIRTEWTREQYCCGTFARTATGEEVAFDDPAAVFWCLEGKIRSVQPLAEKRRNVWRTLERALPTGWTGGFGQYNDDYGWEGAQDLVSHALVQLEAEKNSAGP